MLENVEYVVFKHSKYMYLCVVLLVGSTWWYVKTPHVNTAIKYLAEGLLIVSIQILICQEITYLSVISFVVVNNQ